MTFGKEGLKVVFLVSVGSTCHTEHKSIGWDMGSGEELETDVLKTSLCVNQSLMQMRPLPGAPGASDQDGVDASLGNFAPQVWHRDQRTCVCRVRGNSLCFRRDVDKD